MQLHTVHALHASRVDVRFALDAVRDGIALVSEAAPKTWIHVALFGEWAGYVDDAGEVHVFAFDEAVFAQMIANFESQKNPIPLTYEHPDYKAAAAAGNAIPAAGWIHELQVREDGLWAFVEFTAKAANHVREGEYRYCSIVMDFTSTDRATGEETGARLFEVGLVNRPFIDGMAPIQLSRTAQEIAASRRKQGQVSMSQAGEKLAQIRDALGIDPNLSADEARWAVSDALYALAMLEQAEKALEADLTVAASQRAVRGIRALGGVTKFGAARTKLAAMVSLSALAASVKDLAEQPSEEEVVAAVKAAETKPEEEMKASETGEEPAEPKLAEIEVEIDPVTEQAKSVVDALATVTGIDASEVVAQLESRMDELAAWLQGSTSSEVSASAAKQLHEAQLTAERKKLSAAREATTKARTELSEAQTRILTLEVDLDLAAGRFIDGEPYTREQLIALKQQSAEGYKFALSTSTKVPTGKVHKPSTQKDRVALGAVKDPVAREYAVAKKELREKHPDWNGMKLGQAAMHLASERLKQKNGV